jgi:serine/threonine protein kinase
MHKLLFNKYIISSEVGKGSFSSVYNALSEKTKNKVVIKIEQITYKKGCLFKEYQNYKYLINNNAIKYIPKFYDFIETDNYYLLIIENSGFTLEYLLNSSYLYNYINGQKFKIFDLNYAFKIFYNILHILKYIHNVNLIHRDIKPSNFILKNGKLKIIDFGLSTILTNDELIKSNYDKIGKEGDFIGTLRYCSMNALNGYDISFKDDLESVVYLIIYLSNGYLPWQTSYINKINKLDISIDELCKNKPLIFKDILIYLKKLKFNEKPDYNKYINIIHNY